MSATTRARVISDTSLQQGHFRETVHKHFIAEFGCNIQSCAFLIERAVTRTTAGWKIECFLCSGIQTTVRDGIAIYLIAAQIHYDDGFPVRADPRRMDTRACLPHRVRSAAIKSDQLRLTLRHTVSIKFEKRQCAAGIISQDSLMLKNGDVTGVLSRGLELCLRSQVIESDCTGNFRRHIKDT